ncbi:MAG: leucine-rich repeat domain-containing protein [Oscillospiraceae bacterium]|nr:leucine-rich repeat domain-containing protein [Oscillospiraceae bacterium]
MNEDLFEFKKTKDGYVLKRFNGNPTATEITTAPEYNGQPVVGICSRAFVNSRLLTKITISEGVRQISSNAFAACTGLRSISLPASLETIERYAFFGCKALCEVEFKSSPKFCGNVFFGDYNLPADIALMGAVLSRDITRPLDIELLRDEMKLANDRPSYKPWFSRDDVVALAAANDCFRDIDEELLDALTDYSVKHNKTELTAYFLEFKKRKFGFKKGGDLDL